VIKVENLHKYFGDLEVLKGVNAKIDKSEVVCVIGPSGSGKSTFLRCLNLLEVPTAGKIYIDGIELMEHQKEIDKYRQKVGMVFQQFNLFPHMTVLKNITLAPVKVLGMEQDAADKLAESLLDRVGLLDKKNEFPNRLSGGQKQRVAIARALAMNPEIMILDEATSNVDTHTEVLIQKAMAELMKGRTSFVIAHRLSTIRDADMILYMEDGDIKEVGNHEELMKKNGKYAALYMSQFA